MVSVAGKEFHLEQFQASLPQREAQLVQKMRQACLGLDIVKGVKEALDGGKIVDDTNNTNFKYSVFDDPLNSCFDQKAIIRHIASTPELCSQYCPNNLWQTTSLQTLVKLIDDIQNDLFYLMHTTAGEPARGEEYKSFLLRNAWAKKRTMFVAHKTVMFIQSYKKQATMTGRAGNNVFRFLPPRLAPLFLAFFGILRPFQR